MIFIERIKSGQCIASMGTQLSEFVSVCVCVWNLRVGREGHANVQLQDALRCTCRTSGQRTGRGEMCFSKHRQVARRMSLVNNSHGLTELFIGHSFGNTSSKEIKHFGSSGRNPIPIL